MPGVTVAKFLDHIASVKPSGDGYLGRCPGHEDHVQSLKISEGSDGRCLIHCHAGCRTSHILNALGLTLGDLFPPNTESPGKQPTAIYDYRNADGELAYQVLRFPPKDFRQRKPDGQGGWVWRMNGVKYLPYRLNELKGRETVVIVEGEKDANRLWDLGIPATTNAGGAGKWRQAQTKLLKSVGVERLIVLPDNDEPGQAHAISIAKTAALENLLCAVLPLDGLPKHGDVCDWLSLGHTVEDLHDRLDALNFPPPVNGDHYAPPSPGYAAPDEAFAGATEVSGDEYHLTDLGAAESFRDAFTNDVRFDHALDSWLVWHEHYWKPDATEQARRHAYDHARDWQKRAHDIVDYTRRAKVIDFTMKLERRGQIESTLMMARSLLPIASTGTEWDTDGWLLGCPNGVVDLRTGERRDGERTDWITQQVGTHYDPDAECPRWEQFVAEVLDDQPEVIEFVHRALGYSLTGDVREQCFFMALGGGANGKSIFLDTLENIWGSYGHRAKMRMFIGSGETDKFHLAGLRGARFVFAAETKPGLRMNEDIIKALTGGESVRAEHKYGQPFTFHPCGKIWLGVNHEPKVADDSMGFWRRVRIIPFPRTFQGTVNDLTLRNALRAEAPGILRWAIDGCLAWQTHGLVPPSAVMLATDQYQQQEDPLNEFLLDRCEFDAAASVAFSTLFAEYQDWADKNKLNQRERLSRRSMGSNLQRRFSQSRSSDTRRYEGICIKKPLLG